MEINRAETLAEIEEAFAKYQQALLDNDVATLDALFWNSAHTIRYGATENLYGFDEIAAFRAARPSVGLARRILKSVVTSYGTDYATTNVEFVRDGLAKIGRQSQTWVRFEEGWRVVAAHVSLI